MVRINNTCMKCEKCEYYNKYIIILASVPGLPRSCAHFNYAHACLPLTYAHN